MRTPIFVGLAAVLVLLGSTHITAAIITVDNKYPYAGDYQTLQAAHDAAAAGDTIFVYPSIVPYGAITVTKQLTFYGVGFDITETIGEPFTPTSSITGTIIFSLASEGAWLEGFDGNFYVEVSANNVTLKRNVLRRIIFIPGGGSGSAVIQNKIIVANNSQACIQASGNSILISHNQIINTGSSSYAISGGTNLIIYNNVLSASYYALYGMNGSEVVNNIILHGGISDNISVFRYNMYYSTNGFLSNGIGNLQNVDMSTVFVDHLNFDFHLLSSSPAVGNGENGTDMGIYGGDAPYVDGGFPGLPSILQILAPTIGSQQSGLNIQFKAKSNKE